MKRIKFVLKYLRSFLPEQMPVGMTTFNEFSNDIIELVGPIADRESLTYVVATTIISLPASTSWVTKRTIINRIRKAAANQIASAVFQEIQNATKARLAAQQAEATAQDTKAVVNGEKA